MTLHLHKAQNVRQCHIFVANFRWLAQNFEDNQPVDDVTNVSIDILGKYMRSILLFMKGKYQ